MSTSTAETTTPFIRTNPGDLITAELMNDIQVQTKEEIARRVAAGVASVKEVDRARDSARLEGKTARELADEIVRRAMAVLPSLSRYKVVYKRLQPGEPASILHGLMAYPLVDVYQLASFRAVVSADEQQTVEQVHWYLYHRTEMKIRNPENTGDRLITIEESRGPVFKHTFQSMLDLYEVPFNEQSTLGDVVNEFWKALFSGLNDQFDETAYGNSPWFDRCCGDRRTVESLKRGGEWNDLYVKVMPVKTLNAAEPRAPLPVLVEHYSLEEVGLWWLAGTGAAAGAAAQARVRLQDVAKEEMDTVGEQEQPALHDAVGNQLRAAGVGAATMNQIRTRFLADRTGEGDGPGQPEELRVMVLLKV